MVKKIMQSTKFIFLAFVIFSCLLLFSCETTNENLSTAENSALNNKESNTTETKQKGVHLFGDIDSLNIKPFIQNNFEWVTLVPWSHQKDFNSNGIEYSRRGRMDEAKIDSSWKERIAVVHNAGLKVFLKPHVWIYESTDGKWRSDIYPTSDANWEEWKKTYREFILLYAKIATKYKVELFCVGTELTRLSLEKKAFWVDLIKEVRTIYPGKITYAANWYEEYEQITFWEQLDYIGVQAYFPLVKNNNPTIEEISKGWEKHVDRLESIQKKYNKKILFTELGYKSTPDSAKEPWTWIDYSNTDKIIASSETQSNCYQAFFNSVWDKEWFMGVHIWQMRGDNDRDRHNNIDFTPQGKPALDIIAKEFQ